jgi:hypothetical protein
MNSGRLDRVAAVVSPGDIGLTDQERLREQEVNRELNRALAEVERNLGLNMTVEAAQLIMECRAWTSHLGGPPPPSVISLLGDHGPLTKVYLRHFLWRGELPKPSDGQQ